MKNKRWTDTEDNFLICNRYKGYAYCAKKLNRSAMAVWVRASKLGLGGCVSGSEYLTGLGIANITGVSKHDIWDWFKKGLIKHKIAPTNQKCYLVKVSDLEDFLKNNQDLWDSRNLKVSLWWNKPDWFKEKVQRDKLVPFNRTRKNGWSELEIQKLITMRVVYRHTCKEIGDILEKSENAVYKKLIRLRKQGRLYIPKFREST